MSKVVEKDEGSERKKLIIIRILQVLEEYSDVNHPLKQSEIEKILLDKYDISAERKAIGRNLQLLQDMFDKDALVFDNGQIEWAALALPDGKPYIAFV